MEEITCVGGGVCHALSGTGGGSSLSLIVDGHVCLKHVHGVTKQAALVVAPFPPHLLGFCSVSS